MKYNFRDDTRRALADARHEAMELGHDYVGTEHMLLGMLRARGCRGAQLLAGLGLSASQVRARLMDRIKPGKSQPRPNELPYTSRAKKVLELTMAAARDLGDPYCGTQHLLLGLLNEERGIAAHVLLESGVTPDRVRAALAGGAPVPSGPRAAAAAPPSEPRLRIEIDDRSDRSIYEQIVARVKEAVAIGEMAAGERLPTVRRLADQLDIAPGTVARAYSELERLGVVVTEGARGTRVAEPSASTGGRSVDIEQIAGLLRPAAVAAFHMGSGAEELRTALEVAMGGIFDE